MNPLLKAGIILAAYYAINALFKYIKKKFFKKPAIEVAPEVEANVSEEISNATGIPEQYLANKVDTLDGTQFAFYTDCASMAIYDPKVLDSRVKDKEQWFLGTMKMGASYFNDVDEIKAGKIALASLGADGIYMVKTTFSGLSEHEQEYYEDYGSLGLTIESGTCCLGGLELLPWDGYKGWEHMDAGQGVLAPLENGHYKLSFWQSVVIEVPEQDGKPAPDFIITLEKVDAPFEPNTREEISLFS